MRTIHALFGAPHGAKRADPPALAPRNENENEAENEGETATPALERPEKRRRGSAPGASSLGECPLCGRSFHLALLQAHAAGCAGKAPPPDRPPPRTDAAAAAAAARADGVAPPPTRPSPSPATLEPARSSAPVSPGRAAAGVATFAALMKAQRGATVKRAFSLWRDARTGAFRWALERGSEPGAETSAALASAGGIAWRARVRLKETSADGRPCETTLFLATSVAPASAAESAAIRDTARGVHSSEGSSGSVGGDTARRPDRETPRLAPSLVKSALQKCVRRGRVGGAHRTAALLLAEAPADALRRLLVIAVEDAAAHPDSPLVAWLMCADSKGFKLPRAVVDAVAGFAAELAACAIKDRADPPPKTPTTPPEGRSSESAGALAARNVHAQCAGLGARASAIVAALAIRARFGGMAGDVEMLRSFAATWRSRFLGEDGAGSDGAGSADCWLARLDLVYAEARRKAREALGAEGVSSATGPGVVSRRDVPPAAVDFHVSPVVEELARNERVVAAAAEAAKRAGDELGTRDPGEMLTTAMWRFASSATNKVPWTPEGGATGPAGSEGSEGSGGGTARGRDARTRRWRCSGGRWRTSWRVFRGGSSRGGSSDDEGRRRKPRGESAPRGIRAKGDCDRRTTLA